MRLAAAFLLLASLASQAQAQAAMSDPVDADPAGLDVIMAGVSFGPGNIAKVGAEFASGEVFEGAALRGVLLVGEPDTSEPAEWYEFTIANGTQVFAAHGTPRELHVIASSWTNGTAQIEFERVEPAQGSCIFVVVESGVFGPGGFERADVAPHGFASMDSAWPVSACPADTVAFDDDVSMEQEKRSPGLALPVLVVATAGAALLWRRR